MAKKFPVKVIITADDKATGPIKRIASAIESRLSKRMVGLAREAGKATKKLGGVIGKMAKIGGVAVVGGLGVAIKKFGDFDLAVAKIGTLLPESRDAFRDFADTIQSDSVRFGQSSADVAESIFQAISAGVDPSVESIKSFNQVVGEAAAGGFTDMTTVVDGLTTVLNTYGLETNKAREVSDAFFVANRLGKTTFEELSAQVGTVVSTAKTLGVGYKELLSTTVSLTTGGKGTEKAMTGLRAVLSSIVKPSSDAKKAAKDLGLELSSVALKNKGLGPFLADLAKKTEGNTEAQIALFGNVKAFDAISRLASKGGLAKFNESLAGMKENSNATALAFGKTTKTVGFKTKQLSSLIGAFFTATGGGFFEGLGFSPDLDPAALTERVTSAAKAMGETIGEVVGAIGRFIFDINFDAIGEGFRRVGNVISGVLSAVKIVWKATFVFFLALISPLLLFFGAIGTVVGAVVAAITGDWESFNGFFRDLWDGIVGFLENAFEDIEDVFDGVRDIAATLSLGLVDSASEAEAADEREFNESLAAGGGEHTGRGLIENISGLAGLLGGESSEQSIRAVFEFVNAPAGTKMKTVESSSPNLSASTKVGRSNMASGG